jgi:hypothetical protein
LYVSITSERYCLLLMDIVVLNSKPVKCVLVCFHVDDLNMKREFNGLKVALNFLGMKKGVIVTHNQSDFYEIEDITMEFVLAWKYLA